MSMEHRRAGRVQGELCIKSSARTNHHRDSFVQLSTRSPYDHEQVCHHQTVDCSNVSYNATFRTQVPLLLVLRLSSYYVPLDCLLDVDERALMGCRISLVKDVSQCERLLRVKSCWPQDSAGRRDPRASSGIGDKSFGRHSGSINAKLRER